MGGGGATLMTSKRPFFAALETEWDLPVESLEPLSGGMGSQTWLVTGTERRYVAKLAAQCANDRHALRVPIATALLGEHRRRCREGLPMPFVRGSSAKVQVGEAKPSASLHAGAGFAPASRRVPMDR